MKTVNSISGGMTSAMIAAQYPADFNFFALVTSEDPLVKFPDSKLRQKVSDRIGREFVGTLEDDLIIYTIFELEQFIGSEITWVAGLPFEEIIARGGGEFRDVRETRYLPNSMSRYCTTYMKLEPMFNFWLTNIGEPVEMRIGFRANEGRRVKNTIDKVDENMMLSYRNVETRNIKTRRNNWRETIWQKPAFPLYDDGVHKQDVLNFWDGKPVTFAPLNNCIGCFHKNPLLLKKMSDDHPNKFEWFIKQEDGAHSHWKSESSYKKIKAFNPQAEILFSDWEDDCDSGYCGL